MTNDAARDVVAVDPRSLLDERILLTERVGGRRISRRLQQFQHSQRGVRSPVHANRAAAPGWTDHEGDPRIIESDNPRDSFFGNNLDRTGDEIFKRYEVIVQKC